MRFSWLQIRIDAAAAPGDLQVEKRNGYVNWGKPLTCESPAPYTRIDRRVRSGAADNR
jgi:hypothetical protein